MTTAEQHLNEHDQGQSAGNRLMQGLLIAAIAASALSMIFSVGTAMASASGQQPASSVATSE